MGDKTALNYLAILDKILVKSRNIIKESRHFKVYLPMDHNEIWGKAHEERRKADVIIILPEEVDYTDKIFAPRRTIVKENEKYKIYLPTKYNSIWEKLRKQNKKVDLLILFKS